MTKQQYELYDKKKKQLEPVKKFLQWCGNRYHDKAVSKYSFSLRTIEKRFHLMRLWSSFDKEENTFTIPFDLQERIVAVIEDYVDEKEKEMEQI